MVNINKPLKLKEIDEINERLWPKPWLTIDYCYECKTHWGCILVKLLAIMQLRNVDEIGPNFLHFDSNVMVHISTNKSK